MKLLELVQFLQRMAESNLEVHLKEEPHNDHEIGYHEGQLSILEPLIPRIPPDVEALEAKDEQ